ncbi:hypothetical protein ASC77_02050 [Nocardioides sp. Root1257]|uniref:DUF1707 SHOCT-like domain-containing protein n=1 Tax=unclassified Nocardioides TaxID=2615069 RepID=UPI0006F45904|nr:MULTISPECIES: DUF1707 domain-containing protein [unclassified Nocardioides]KQW53105.1 hypothetical protein ASC77_02050 [Nocardioides sp. Root1257]KRC55793.1 hypothetical protein ASE24_02050 [Nocardioides sp. Root224]
MDREFWSSFSRDPRDAQFQSMRASDQDRAVVQQALTEAYADGRLDREEFDERSGQALQTRTLGELAPLVADLVSTATPTPARAGLAEATPTEIHDRAVEKYRSDRREAVFGFLFATLICTVIWFLTTGPGHFPWPAFVALGTGINVAKTVSRKRDIVASHERRLEKKRAKELGQPWTPDDRASE